MTTDNDWCILCVPDGEDLEPPPEELASMYQTLENGSMLELLWKCPGRRLPSPTIADDAEDAESSEKETPVKNKDYDFMDEVSAPTIRVRTQNATSKSTGKKKTANFAGILDAMKKHGRLAQPASAAASSSPSKESSSSTS